MRNETTEEPVYLSIGGEATRESSVAVDETHRDTYSTRTNREHRKTTDQNQKMHNQRQCRIEEHNNRLPFDLRRATAIEVRRRRGEPPRERSPTRATEGNIAD
ncbi:hypothetical protein DY000_02023778 [Brassica cretica]|uniref:Uncharacterized protein n=1 Tax=Brassica cretica TaxID=69181 RepID=A0ABQ7E1G1_BRACR|nr:hypothetical protein DY000_02023778 [Brassica cretica]